HGTERAAVSAVRLRSRGNEKAADRAAVDAAPRTPMLYIGEKDRIQDMVRGDCLVLCNRSHGWLLTFGVRFRCNVIETESIATRSVSGTLRIIKGEHRQLEKSIWSGHGAFCKDSTSSTPATMLPAAANP
ncbi:MAG TPA: hypothetical protein VN920_04330, partial [Pyrinomonadaceae bacterium]|nr:hypothetical protein [Pyrinomonadaceae bacterium]